MSPLHMLYSILLNPAIFFLLYWCIFHEGVCSMWKVCGQHKAQQNYLRLQLVTPLFALNEDGERIFHFSLILKWSNQSTAVDSSHINSCVSTHKHIRSQTEWCCPLTVPHVLWRCNESASQIQVRPVLRPRVSNVQHSSSSGTVPGSGSKKPY